ncbi:MAG: hypothetical protein VB104_06925 [Candidatus Limiplasma sp.]|nr:hypothetical protein [Candidatus Limiplasma sp.]
MERRAGKWEFESLKMLIHLVAETIEAQKHLSAVAEVAGCTAELTAFTEMGKLVLGKLTDTLPIHQRRQLLRHASDMKVAFTSPVAISRDEAYVYVPRETILKLIQSAAPDKCGLCLGEPEDVRTCRFRQAVNELRMDNAPDDVLGCTVRLLAAPVPKGDVCP